MVNAYKITTLNPFQQGYKIISNRTRGKRGTIKGIAKDNVKVAEVTVDGKSISFSTNGNFEYSTYVVIIHMFRFYTILKKIWFSKTLVFERSIVLEFLIFLLFIS